MFELEDRASRGDDALETERPFFMELGRRSAAGAELAEMNEGLRRYFDNVQGGALVIDVSPNTPAARAGLEAGDVIVRAGGREVNGPEDVRRALMARGRRQRGAGGGAPGPPPRADAAVGRPRARHPPRGCADTVRAASRADRAHAYAGAGPRARSAAELSTTPVHEKARSSDGAGFFVSAGTATAFHAEVAGVTEER